VELKPAEPRQGTGGKESSGVADQDWMTKQSKDLVVIIMFLYKGRMWVLKSWERTKQQEAN
jgi:hypothetical protein